MRNSVWCWPGPTAATASSASVLACFGVMTGACNKECSDVAAWHVSCKPSALYQPDKAYKTARNFSEVEPNVEGLTCIFTSKPKSYNCAADKRVG